MTKDTLSLFDDVDAPRTAVQPGDDLEAAMNVGIDAAVAHLFTPPTAPAEPSVAPPAPMTDAEYHAHPAVSATDLKRAFERGPWYAPWCRANKTSTRAMDQGTRIHDAMLRRETIDVSKYVARPEGMKFQGTKPGTGGYWKAEQEANGLTVVEANEFAFYADANRVLSDWNRLLDSVPGTWVFETPVFWTDRESVDCRCKPDAVCFDGAKVTLFSVKTTAKPVTGSEWRRQVESKIVTDADGLTTVHPGYDVSERHYAEGLAQHYLGDAERWPEVVVVHIIVPTEGPLCLYHAPVPAELLQRVGRLRSDMLPMVADAIETYPACVPGGVMSLTYAPSKWAARDMEEEA